MTDDPWADQEEFGYLCEDVHGSLAEHIRKFDGSMLVKYLTVAEVMGADGERAVVSLTSKDMKSWESLGMIEYLRQLEQAQTTRDEDGS